MTATDQSWIWLDAHVLLAVHDEQLTEQGGISGVRDMGLFESVLSRSQHLADYDTPDCASLAAAYGYGIARNNSFLDGNKRTAFVAVELFLILNGYVLNATDVACVVNMLSVAAGDMDEQTFAEWIRQHATVQS
jgi:death-on-curing protein